jgi:hypothetical protein
MGIEIIEDKEIWDNFVDKSPYGMLFHKWDFLKIAEKYSNFKLLAYGIYKGEALIALFPMFYKKRNGLNLIFSPPPKTGIAYLGFIMNKEYDTLKQNKKEGILSYLSEEIDQELIRYNPDYISISTVPSFIDIRVFKWSKYFVEPDFTYYFDLRKSNDELWNGLKGKIRNNIKEAEELGMKLTKGSDLDGYYEMLKTRYEESPSSLTHINKNYIEDITETFPENISIYYLSSRDDEILNVLLTQGYKTHYMLWLGCLKIKMPGTEYMVWKVIADAKARGYTKAENPGADVERLNEFKAKFNPELGIFYKIVKKTNLGRIGEWGYSKFYKKGII